jgi:hypothetical protein
MLTSWGSRKPLRKIILLLFSGALTLLVILLGNGLIRWAEVEEFLVALG